MEIIVLSCASLLAGFVDAIAGGGGVVTFPVFLFLGLPVSQIVGTNKLVSTAGTSVAALTFLKKGLMQREVVGAALPWTFLGAIAGAATVLMVPNDFLKPCVSVLVVAVALYCYFRPQIGLDHTYEGITPRTRMLLVVAGFGLGFYDGFFGPGTGIFLTFFFIKFIY